MTATQRVVTSVGTTGAIAWTINGYDDFEVPLLTIVFDSAPSSAGSITITKDSATGAAYDTVIRSINPVGAASVAVEGIKGLRYGDQLLVAYANPDNRDWNAEATIEV